MNSDHARRSRVRPERSLIHHTYFSYIALWVAVLMIVPVSLIAGVAREARADGPNQTCEVLCVENTPGTFTCANDPNDPDCSAPPITFTHVCNCTDGNSSVQDLNTSCDLACVGHGGACTLLSCFVPPNEDPFELASLDFFNGNVAQLRLYAFDPDSGALLFDNNTDATFALIALELKAVDEVIKAHGLPTSDKPLVRTWARDRVRAQILDEFNRIIKAPASERTVPVPPGQVTPPTPQLTDLGLLYEWLTQLVWKKRIATAQNAWDQYRSWRYAVDFAKCDWHSPTQDGIVTLTFHPNTNTFSNDTVSAGCSPGVDGIPKTDTTPNSGSLADIVEGRDDGESCFDLPKADSFVISGNDDTPSYDALTGSRCAGASPVFDVSLAAHPSVEHFLEYGLAIARKNQIITPGFASTLGNTFKEEAFGIGTGLSGLAGAGTAAAVYAAGGWSVYTKTIAPFSGRAVLNTSEAATKVATGVSTRAAGALAAGAIVIEVVGNLVTAILTLIDIIEFNDVPVKLKAVLRAATGSTETGVKISDNYTFTTGKPDLATLVDTDAGKDEIRFALIEALSPDKEVTGTAPLPDPSLFWAQTQANGTKFTTPPLTRSLLVDSWPVNKPFEKVTVGLNGGWFTTQVADANGTVTRSLDLGIDYKDCDGKQRRAWRVANGQFVSLPMGTSAADADWTTAARVNELQYQPYVQGLGCLTARINHAPTASGIMVMGTQSEGQSLSFTSSGSDPDGDAFNPAWSFGDGATASGSSVQHTFVDNGAFTVKMTASDAFGATGNEKTQALSIGNALPVVGTISGPTGRVQLNTPVNLSASFTDAGVADTHTATWDWGDGAVTAGTVQEASGSGTVTGSHPYTKGGTYTVKLTVTDDDAGARQATFPVTVNKRLSAAGPAQLWIGLTNSDDVGLKLDAKAEVLLNNQVIGTGQLNELKGGSSGFNNAVLQSIPLTLSSTPEVPASASLAVRVGVRIACTGKITKKSGRVRLWYDGKSIDTGKTADAGSRASVTLDTDNSTYFLRSGTPLTLSPAAGTAKQSIDVTIDSKVACPSRPFTTIGTWSVPIP